MRYATSVVSLIEPASTLLSSQAVSQYAQAAGELINASALVSVVSHVSGPDVAQPAADGETETMNRRELLRVLSIAGGLVALPDGLALPAPAHGAPEGPRSDAVTLDHYAAVNGLLWQTFATSQSKSAVQPLVVGQLNLLTSSLEAARTDYVRTRLCELLGGLFQLAGEIAVDTILDRRDPRSSLGRGR